VAGPTLVALLLIAGVAFYLLIYRKADSDGLGMFGGGGGAIPTSKTMTLRSARQATALSHSKVGTLGRQRNVVVNNAFSIPFDDGGDVANDDDAVVAAAAAAAGYLLVTIDADDEVGTDTSNRDYDPAGEGGPAQFYQNVDNTPWVGKVQEGPRDYENAPSTTLLLGKDGTSTNRTGNTSSNTLVKYENVPTLRKTVRHGGGNPGDESARTASTSSNTLEMHTTIPTMRKTVVRRGRGSSDGANSMQSNDNEMPPALPKEGRIADLQTSNTNDYTTHDPSTDEDLDDYEVVEVQKLPEAKASLEGYEGPPPPLISSGDVEAIKRDASIEKHLLASKQTEEVRKMRKHRAGCKCGGHACKLEPVWWCATCGSEATATLTAAEAEACELKHQSLRVMTLRQNPQMMTKFDGGDSDGDGADGEARMYSAPNNAAATYAAGGGGDAPQMYSAPTDAGETYDGIEPVRGDARMYSQPTAVGQMYAGATDA
jgi:hypothetical protein